MVVERVDDQLPAVAQDVEGGGRVAVGPDAADLPDAEQARHHHQRRQQPAGDVLCQLQALPAMVGAPAAAGAGCGAVAGRVGACAAGGATRAWASWAMGRSNCPEAVRRRA